jgi:hypothetical protein
MSSLSSVCLSSVLKIVILCPRGWPQAPVLRGVMHELPRIGELSYDGKIPL